MKKFWKILLIVLAVLLAAVVLLFAWLTITEYRPDPVTELDVVSSEEGSLIPSDRELSIMSWNIGYAGLGEDSDFFMDGGEGVRPSDAETVRQNMLGIEDLIRGADADFVMLQEVDTDSKRSYGYDQWRQYEFDLADYESRFALNYSCDYVPYPVTEPIGRVHSGVATYSRYDITAVTACRARSRGRCASPISSAVCSSPASPSTARSRSSCS